MTHWETEQDRMPLNELFDEVLDNWLNPESDYLGSHRLYPAGFNQRHQSNWLSYALREAYTIRREDEVLDYRVMRARDLCEAFRADEVEIVERLSYAHYLPETVARVWPRRIIQSRARLAALEHHQVVTLARLKHLEEQRLDVRRKNKELNALHEKRMAEGRERSSRSRFGIGGSR